MDPGEHVEVLEQPLSGTRKTSGYVFVGGLMGLCVIAVAVLFSVYGPRGLTEVPVSLFEVLQEADGGPCNWESEAIPLRNNAYGIGYGNTPNQHKIVLEEKLSDQEIVIFLTTIVDRAALHVCDQGSIVETMFAGDDLPANARALLSQRLAFPIRPEWQHATLILEVVQGAAIQQRVGAAAINEFLAQSRFSLAISLFLMGGVMAMVLYNFTLGILVRQPTFTFNALTILSMVVLNLCLSGIGPAYVWGGSPAYSNYTIAIAEAGPTLFGPLYVFYFLRGNAGETPWRKPLFMMFPLLALVFLALAFIGPYWMGLIGLVAIWILAAVVFVFYLVRKARYGDERAAILLVPLLAAVVPAMLIGIAGYFMGIHFGFASDHSLEFSLLLEAVLFTLATAYMIRTLEARNHELLLERAEKSSDIQHQMLQAIDSERSRIAGDLHDTAGQGVVTIVNRLSRIRKGLKGPASQKLALSQTEEATLQLLREVRRISHDLFPAELQHLGFNEALRELAERVRNANGTEIQLENQLGADTLSSDQAIQVYRILQELLSNAITHGKATRCIIGIGKDGSRCRIVVEDNGGGISADTSMGIGLNILNQRISALRGTCQTHSDETGTRVVFTFPMETG